MRILVVDGDPAARAATVSCLRETYPDAEIVATGDGMEAVQVSLNTPVDAVYTEVLMPRISGFDVTRLVRKFRPEAAAYLVSETDEYVDGARQRGLSGYYLKPLAGDALTAGNLLAHGERLRCAVQAAERQAEEIGEGVYPFSMWGTPHGISSYKQKF